MGNEIIKVSSQAQFAEEINRISSNNIFRGQSLFREQCGIIRYIYSSAARRLKNNNKPYNIIDLYNYTCDLISGYDTNVIKDRSNKPKNPLECLSLIQHFGGSTILIDFTLNSNVALYFACANNFDKDGAVFVMNKSDMREVNISEFEKEIIERIPDKYFSIFNKDLFYWKHNPGTYDEDFLRVTNQSSLFVFGKPFISTGFEKIIVIDGRAKKTILKELRGNNTKDFVLFPDYVGYSWLNRVDSYIDRDMFKDVDNGNLIDKQLKVQIDTIDTNIKCLDKVHDNSDIIDNLVFKKVKLLYQADRFDESQKYLDKIKEPEKIQDYHFIKGNIFNKLKMYEEAIDEYHLDSVNNNNNSYSFTNMAYCKLMIEKKLTDSEQVYHDRLLSILEDLDKALILNPEDYHALFTRSNVNRLLGNLENAFIDVNAAIELNQLDKRFYINRSNLYTIKGEIDKAIEDLSIVIFIDPDYFKSYLNRSELYCKRNEFTQALLDVNKAIELMAYKEDVNNHTKCEAFYIRFLIRSKMNCMQDLTDCDYLEAKVFGDKMLEKVILTLKQDKII